MALISPSATNATLTSQGFTTFHRIVPTDGVEGKATADFLAINNKFDHAAEFLKASLRQGVVAEPWVYKSLALALREIILEEAPDASESIYQVYTVAIWFGFSGKMKDMFCYIATATRHVISASRGAPRCPIRTACCRATARSRPSTASSGTPTSLTRIGCSPSTVRTPSIEARSGRRSLTA